MVVEAVTRRDGPRSASSYHINHSRPVSHMRELERDLPSDDGAGLRVAIVGDGRMGRALVRGLGSAPEFAVAGPLGRGADGRGADVVLLCVPDGQIAAAASLVAPGRLVGHCSGAT